jgi:hypothetical protein
LIVWVLSYDEIQMVATDVVLTLPHDGMEITSTRKLQFSIDGIASSDKET